MGLENPLHLAILFVIILLLFGARRLPELGKSLGEGMRGFKDSISGDGPGTSLPAAPAPTAATQTTSPVPQPVAAPTPPPAEPAPTAATPPAMPAPDPAPAHEPAHAAPTPPPAEPTSAPAAPAPGSPGEH